MAGRRAVAINCVACEFIDGVITDCSKSGVLIFRHFYICPQCFGRYNTWKIRLAVREHSHVWVHEGEGVEFL